MKTRNLLLLLTTLALLLGTAGCIFSPDDGTTTEPPAPEALQDPTEPDILMENFQTAYEDMNIEWFRDLMHEDYKTMLQQDTVNEYGLPQNFFTYEEEIDIQTNIFSGNPIPTPNGAIPGISSITFTTFERQGIWTTAPANDPNFPNALFATYNVKFEFTRPGGTTLVVTGFIQFYVIDTQDGDGEWYKLIGQVDLTNG